MGQSFRRRSGSVRSLMLAALLAVGLPAAAGAQTIIEFTTPTPSSETVGVAAGPDGAVWFTEHFAGKIGRVTTAGSISEFPTTSGGPAYIATGPDGNLWFTEDSANKIGRITPNGTISEFPIPTASSFPAIITAGPDGNLWFAEENGNKIGRISPSGTITEFPVPTGSSMPTGITAGPDGALWFTEQNSNKIGRITTTGTVTNEFTIPTASSTPFGITNGPDGALWFAESSGNQIGRVTTAGSFSQFPVITAASVPTGIAVGPDGALWFTEFHANNIGRITTGGAVSEFSLPGTAFAPDGIALGPNNALWFAQFFSAQVGSFQTAALSIVEPGNGSGTVTSNVPVSGTHLNCSAITNPCSLTYMTGLPITLTASAASGSSFTGWSGGGCSGTAPCILTMTSDTTVTANFSLPQVSEMLSVSLSGTGTGTVTSAPSGINCGATCAASFNQGTQVTLTASAAAGSTFGGWSGGGCSGTNACIVTLNANTAVTASFTQTPSFMLGVTTSGTGSGTVTSAPSGINCGPTCQTSFKQGTQVTLNAAPANGSTFAGWSGGGCSGIVSCTVMLNANTVVNASFVANSSGNLTLVAAVLPTSRSVQVGATATAFATIIDAGPDNAATCTIAPATSVPSSFLFQTTNPSTNALTGTVNTPADIAAGQAQSFVIAFTPTAAFAPTNIAFTFTCANAPSPAASIVGVNTLNLSASMSPVPDIVALAASGDPGYVDIPGATGTGVFAVATVNLGVDATIIAAANTGAANLPVTLLVCQTNPQSGACLAAPAASASTDIPPNATPTFGIFATGGGTIVNLPGVNRVFVTFTDAGGVLRGETSVAVRTQ